MNGHIRERSITLSFAGGLRHLLRGSGRGDIVDYPLTRSASIKDIIESMGVPHTEVGGILINNRPAGFDLIPSPGNTITITAIIPPFNPLVPSLLRPEPLPVIRFIVDVNVGKLASLLRLVGFDTRYDREMSDARIAELSARNKRIVLTRDRALLKRRKVMFGHLVQAVKPMGQLVETLSFFGLRPPYALFSRCMACNQRLEPVEKAAIRHRLEPRTKKYFDTFTICPGCNRIYWRGSHFDIITQRLEQAGIHKTRRCFD